jgi:chromate transporter
MAYTVSRLLHRAGSSPWPALIQKALVPVSIGLMAASGLVVAVAADGSVVAALLTLAAAVIAAITRVNPVWLLLAGGLLGLTGLL